MQILKKQPLLIAEISANHNGKIDNALKLISEAKKYGADLIKLQTFKPENMTLNTHKKKFMVKEGIWKNKSLFELYQKGQTPYDWHKKIFNFCKKKKIGCFSTPFHEEDVDFLETLKCPMYKVASFELNYLNLIKKIAKTKKPIILSTGMAKLNEIEIAFNTAKRFGASEIIILYCVSNYPAKNKDFNLNNINFLKKKFNCKVGLSDHSKDNEIVKAAVASGATIIEKHVALRKEKKALDYDFSLKDKEIKTFKSDILNTYDLLGKNFFFREKVEFKNRKFRRSIFTKKVIKKGEKFTKHNLQILRPAIGISPYHYEKLLKQKSPFNFKKNSHLPKSLIRALKLDF
jgi:pseudaminic acid synthase